MNKKLRKGTRSLRQIIWGTVSWYLYSSLFGHFISSFLVHAQRLAHTSLHTGHWSLIIISTSSVPKTTLFENKVRPSLTTGCLNGFYIVQNGQESGIFESITIFFSYRNTIVLKCLTYSSFAKYYYIGHFCLSMRYIICLMRCVRFGNLPPPRISSFYRQTGVSRNKTTDKCNN